MGGGEWQGDGSCQSSMACHCAQAERIFQTENFNYFDQLRFPALPLPSLSLYILSPYYLSLFYTLSPSLSLPHSHFPCLLFLLRCKSICLAVSA